MIKIILSTVHGKVQHSYRPGSLRRQYFHPVPAAKELCKRLEGLWDTCDKRLVVYLPVLTYRLELKATKVAFLVCSFLTIHMKFYDHIFLNIRHGCIVEHIALSDNIICRPLYVGNHDLHITANIHNGIIR